MWWVITCCNNKSKSNPRPKTTKILVELIFSTLTLLHLLQPTISFQSITISTNSQHHYHDHQQTTYYTPNKLSQLHLRRQPQQPQQQRLYKKEKKRLVRQQYENNLNVYNHKFITPSNNIPRRRMKVLLKNYYTPTLFVQGNREVTYTKQTDRITTDDDMHNAAVAARRAKTAAGAGATPNHLEYFDSNINNDDNDFVNHYCPSSSTKEKNKHSDDDGGSKVLNSFVFDNNNNDFIVKDEMTEKKRRPFLGSFKQSMKEKKMVNDCKEEEEQQEDNNTKNNIVVDDKDSSSYDCQCKYGCNGLDLDLEERLQIIVRKSINDFVHQRQHPAENTGVFSGSSSFSSSTAKQQQQYSSSSSSEDNDDNNNEEIIKKNKYKTKQEEVADYFLFDYRCALLHISARKALKKGKLSTARNFYKLFLYEWSGDRLDTSIAHTYFLWALLEQRAKDFNMARSLFIEATTRFPDHPRLLQGWALMESKCGNIDLAKELILKAVKIDPENFLPLLKWKIFKISKEEMVRLSQENKINSYYMDDDTLYEIKKKYPRKRFYRKKKKTIVCKQSKLPI